MKEDQHNMDDLNCNCQVLFTLVLETQQDKMGTSASGLLIPLLPPFPLLPLFLGDPTVLHVGGISDSCDVYRWRRPLCLI